MDVLSTSHLDDEITWYENDGNQAFTPHTITNSADGVSGLHANDLDGDGDIDLVST